jgi:hypothetical protein
MSRRDDEEAKNEEWKCLSHVDPCTREDANTAGNLRGEL